MNIENINRVLERLKQEKAIGARSFFMSGFAAYLDPDAVPDGEWGHFHSCNTALCMAGWANTLRVHESALKRDDFMRSARSEVDAAQWLGLTPAQARALFYVNTWTGTAEVDALPIQTRYDAGIKVLQILLATGRVDWGRAILCAKKNAERVSRETQGV